MSIRAIADVIYAIGIAPRPIAQIIAEYGLKDTVLFVHDVLAKHGTLTDPIRGELAICKCIVSRNGDFVSVTVTMQGRYVFLSSMPFSRMYYDITTLDMQYGHNMMYYQHFVRIWNRHLRLAIAG